MKISKTEIEKYIPQRRPFVMIDSLSDGTPEKFETDFLILSDNIFLEEGVLREFALIENIAQTSSAGISVYQKYGHTKPADGFIGGISKLKLYALPKVNDTIHTVVYLVTQFQNMFLLRGENYLNGEKLLECELKLVGV